MLMTVSTQGQHVIGRGDRGHTGIVLCRIDARFRREVTPHIGTGTLVVAAMLLW